VGILRSVEEQAVLDVGGVAKAAGSTRDRQQPAVVTRNALSHDHDKFNQS
jgi:hypothetical protein